MKKTSIETAISDIIFGGIMSHKIPAEMAAEVLELPELKAMAEELEAARRIIKTLTWALNGASFTKVTARYQLQDALNVYRAVTKRATGPSCEHDWKLSDHGTGGLYFEETCGRCGEQRGSM
jgi:hypothetical protein